MAAPIIPILKKIAVALVSDKKGRNWLLGILCGILFIIIMPIIAVQGIFSSGFDINTEKLFSQVYEQQMKMESIASEIEIEMLNAGYTQTHVEEAQTLYLLALHNEGEEEGFVLRLLGCFKIEHTDEELVSAVNLEFGKNIKTEEFQAALKEIRGSHVLDE